MAFAFKLKKHFTEMDRSVSRSETTSDNIIRTIPNLMAEKGPKTTKIMLNLTNVVDVKKRHLEEMEGKYMKTRETISKLLAENDKLLQSYYEETKDMSFGIREHFQWICNDYEMVNLKLERQEKELKLRSIELQQREIANENKRRKLTKEFEEMAVKSSLLQSKEKLKKLADDHKMEMEKLHEKISSLEKQLKGGNQALFLEIKLLVEKLTLMKKIEDIQNNLKEKEDELEDLENLNQMLVIQEGISNDELQEARKTLIEGFKELSKSTSHIGLKRMGELENKPFYDAMKLKYNQTDAAVKAFELLSLWEGYLRDPNWHPFKVITIDGKSQELIDENDEKLKTLKQDMGEQVYKAVTTALGEINDYITGGRYVINELWNFSEGRKATLQEGCSRLLKMWAAKKRMRIT